MSSTTGINVKGNAAPVEAGAADAVAFAIATVFESAFRTHMDQQTVRDALGVLASNLSRAGVEGMSINGCSISMAADQTDGGSNDG